MSAHLLALPIAWPMLAGALLLMTGRWSPRSRRALSLLACLIGLAASAGLLSATLDQGPVVSAIGNWPVALAIVLVLDPLSGLMLVLSGVLGFAAALHADTRADGDGARWHALLQFQLMGLNGAFLTGDLFNLFVWFEVLLIASYGLLLASSERGTVRAGIGYVVINLCGSALFLVALALIYGSAGTLNMVDLGTALPQLPPPARASMLVAGALLLVVFSVKAALLPLCFWLPGGYAAASGAVAVMFAVLTKVGLYALLRVGGTVYAGEAGLASALLLPVGLATLAVGTIGALAAPDLSRLAAQAVIASAGTAVVAFAVGGAPAVAAGVLYLLQSSLTAALLFLMADGLRRSHADGDRFAASEAQAPSPAQSALLLLALLAIAGVPPFPGFLAKATLLAAAQDHPQAAMVWATLLPASLLLLLACTRAFAMLVWRRTARPIAASVTPQLASLALVALILIASVVIAPIHRAALAAAESALNPAQAGAAQAAATIQPRPTVAP